MDGRRAATARRGPPPLAPLLLLVLTLALLPGCGGGATAGGASADTELVVFAAASLGPAFERYAEGIGYADVRYSFAGSDALAAQIRQGVSPDVYAAANQQLPEELAREGLLQRPRELAINRLVIGVPRDSEIDSIVDLERPGVTVAIGAESVPVGAYARDALARLGPDTADAVLANVATEEPDVGGIVGKLSQGAVDAGFVYRSDVAASNGRLKAVALPRRAHPAVAYGIAVATDASEPALAKRFVAGLLRGPGRRVLLAAGFGAPPGR